jgi:hypothetical protein
LPSFTVTAAGQRVNLDASGAAQAPFTVTNTSVQTLRGRLLTRPKDPAKPEWLSIVGESTRDFGPNAAEQVVVQLNVPPTTPPGKYSFRLDAVSEVDPDEDYTEGPSVAFEVVAAAPPPKKKFPWWIFVIIGAVVLLIIIGVVVWLLTKDSGNKKLVPVPPVTNVPLAQAQSVLTATGFKVAVQNVPVRTSASVGMVTSQDPQANAQAEKGSTVTIRVGAVRVIETIGTPTGRIATIEVLPPPGGAATLQIETARLRTMQTP